MTPAPSNGPQSSTVTCGQSRIEVSLPIHWTLSIPKVSATGPNQDCTVALPEEYPSILSSFFRNCKSQEWSTSWAKKTVFQQTCTLQEHFGHCVHHHRQEGHWQRCALRKGQTRPPTWPLKWILSTKTRLFPNIDSSPGLSRGVLSVESLLPESLDGPALMIMLANVEVSSSIPILVQC